MDEFMFWSRMKVKAGFSIGFLILGFLIVNLILVELAIGNEKKCQYISSDYAGLQPSLLEERLQTTGLIGRIHGAVAEAGLFLLTVRDSENFFNFIDYSLVADNLEVLKTLDSLKRHDLVCVGGEFLPNPSLQQHIQVTQLSLLEPWRELKSATPYQREVELPEDLKGKKEFIGQVHAISGQGSVLVMEYKDAILPVFVGEPTHSERLYRGDIVKIHFRPQNRPNKPLHLNLDPAVEKPIEVIESIASLHGRSVVMEGRLVKFPKSPQIAFDVFAIERDAWGTKRHFTLVNLRDPEIFGKIREKLAQIWQSRSQSVVAGRNLLVNPDLNLQVRGTVNVVSPQQANPQILLESVNDIAILN